MSGAIGAIWRVWGQTAALWVLVILAIAVAALEASARRLLEGENRRLRLTVNASEDGKVSLDAERCITHANRAFRRAFAHLPGQRESFARFLIRTFAPQGLAPLIAAVETASAWHGRLVTLPRPDGPAEPRWFDLLVQPMEEGEEASALVRLREVTDLVAEERRQRLAVEGEKAKAEIAEAMSLEMALAERCSASLASVCQIEGLETFCKGAVFLRPETEEAAEGGLQLLSYCGDFSPAFLASAPQAAAWFPGVDEGRVLTLERCTPGSGACPHCDEARPHGHYLVPLMERPGHASGFMLLYTSPGPIDHAARLEGLLAIAELFANAVLRDRTARLLRESSQRAEEATRAKSDFLATMSHEIRTPMNGVLGFTQLLLESSLSDEQREHAQLIFNSAEALLALLNDILDFSKIEAGKLVIDPRPAAIVESSREAIGLLRAAASRKGLALELEVGPSVPAGLLIDTMRFRQVLLNLTGNAVKFTPSGSVRVSLDVEVEAAARWLSVKVQDTGIGISAAVLPNLFGKFVQADTSTSRRFGGSGLGLAISKRLVELMGGTIGATSAEGRGSTFWFKLPIVEAVVEGGRRVEGRSQRQAAHRRVLLAEDNPINQTLAKKVLEKMQAEVVVAPNGRRAVELTRGGGFDLVLMDCQMPEMDGYDATRAIREWESSEGRGRLPIIAVTANAFADDIQACLTAGMDAVLTKPFKLADLERTLSNLDTPRETG